MSATIDGRPLEQPSHHLLLVLLRLVVDARVQQINEALVLFLHVLDRVFQLSDLLVQLVQVVRLLVVQMLQVAYLLLLLVDSSPEVFALVVLLVEGALQIFKFGLLHRQQLVIVAGHCVSLPCHLIYGSFFQQQTLLLLLDRFFQV